MLVDDQLQGTPATLIHGVGGGQAVAAWLARQGRSMRWLARKAGVSPATVSRFVRRSVAPSSTVVYRLAEATGIPVQRLFGVVVREFIITSSAMDPVLPRDRA